MTPRATNAGVVSRHYLGVTTVIDHTSELFCRQCEQFYPPTTEYWYADKGKPSGFCTPCKKCRLKYQSRYSLENAERKAKRSQKWRETHREQHRDYSSQWRDEHPEEYQETKEAYSINNPDKFRAHRTVHNAVRRGKLPRVTLLACEDCGGKADNYHHEDYSKPLDVIPLCHSCHRKRHRKYA